MPHEPTSALLAAVTAYRKSLEPKERYHVECHPKGEPRIKDRTEVNVLICVNGLGYSGGMEYAERICRLLNREDAR